MEWFTVVQLYPSFFGKSSKDHIGVHVANESLEPLAVNSEPVRMR